MFPYSLWCSLPINKRHEIAKRFNIPKHGPTEVVSNQIKADGYSVHDIDAALTLERVQTELDTTETQMHILWDYLINGKPQPVVDVVVGSSDALDHFVEPTPTIIPEQKDKIDYIKRPVKKGKK